MADSRSTLHPTGELLEEQGAAMRRHAQDRLRGPRAYEAFDAALNQAIPIPITTVASDKSFDAYLMVRLQGAADRAGRPHVVDSGNSNLIHPRWEDIESIPGHLAAYRVLGSGDEPWGCPANVVRGPIELMTEFGQTLTIADCVFYACTGDNPKTGERTANFGTGCIHPWSANGWNVPAGLGVTMQAPLSYLTDYPYLQFDFEAANSIFSAAPNPGVSFGSRLVLSKAMPLGFTSFDILPQREWMALKPKSIAIGTSKTGWPGPAGDPIAVIDTGGTCAFLSDPDGYLYDKAWPAPTGNPDWAKDSTACQSIAGNVTIELGDAFSSFSYSIGPSTLPPSVRGLTLVMCRTNSYMMGELGMNIGGISALVNWIMVDHANHRVGFKAK